MCGRYFFDLESELLQNYYREAQTKQPEQAAELAAGEVFPSNLVVTLRKEEENILTPEIMKWGFTGFKKGQLMINARAETVEEKKTFHQPFLQNRCVFPMSGFYEWNEEKDKFMFSNKEKIVYIGGFYRSHQDEKMAESIIMTTEPNRTVAPIHDRMPLVLTEEQIEPWVTDVSFARKIITQQMPELVWRRYNIIDFSKKERQKTKKTSAQIPKTKRTEEMLISCIYCIYRVTVDLSKV